MIRERGAEIQILSMNRIKQLIFTAVIILTSVFSQSINAQNISSYTWSYTKIDSTFNPKSENLSGSIIGKYSPTIDPLTETIGHTTEEMRAFTPESPLSNLAADIIYKFGNSYLEESGCKKGVDIAITNFGGIRTDLPKGAINSFNILSIFPFDNSVVILDVKGADIREMFENFARKGRTEALSGVKVVIEHNKLKELLIGGKKLKDNKIYKIATIDFLLGGGDGLYALKEADSVVTTDAVLRDVIISYIKSEEAAGRKISTKVDGRVVIIK